MQPRRIGRVLVGLAVALVVTGCRGEVAGGTDRVRIGFVTSLSGPYQAVGEDLRDGFQLYVELQNGQLGGRPVEVILADEGLGAADARPAATRLIRQEQVDALAGIVNADSFLAVNELATQQQIPLVGSNGRPTALWDEGIDWMWNTSFLNQHSGRAIAPYVVEHVAGPVWVLGPDNRGGIDVLGGFTEEYTGLGGELANPDGQATLVPFPETNNFVPYLAEIAGSEAAAIYAFFAGVQAVDFVTQWAQSPAADLPLYGVALTEGAVLDAQGAAAEGVFNVFNYSPDLDNPANQRFVTEWSARYERTPTSFAMASYDAGYVFDQAIAAIDGEVTPAALNQAIAGLGQLDSPRGPWRFSPVTHAPIQRWYLRVVARDRSEWANVLLEYLAVVRD